MKKSNYSQNDFGQYFAFVFCCALVASALLPAIFPNSNDDSFQFWFMQALYTLVIGGTSVLYATFTKTNFIRANGAGKKPSAKHLLWGMALTIFLICLMSPLNEWIMDGIEALGFRRPSVAVENHMQIVPLLLISCLLAAVCEEFVFRGTLTSCLKAKSELVAVLACGGMFSLFHLNPAQTIHQFALGCVLSLVFLRSQSVWTAVIVHLFNNLMAVLLTYLLPSDFVANNALLMLVVGAVGFAATITLYLLNTSKNAEAAEQKAADKPNGRSWLLLIFSVVLCVFLWITQLVQK